MKLDMRQTVSKSSALVGESHCLKGGGQNMSVSRWVPQIEPGRHKTEREMGSPRFRESKISSFIRRERRSGVK